MSARALSFGATAEAYERFRPGYPKELFDLVMTYAGLLGPDGPGDRCGNRQSNPPVR